VKKEKEKLETREMGFIDRMLEKLRINVQEPAEEKSGFIKYLEDLKKISK
jgi:hypothetical protein